MKTPLFDFYLDDIRDCDGFRDLRNEPSWYGLTCGYYRIAAGNDLLLNYSDQIVDKWKRNGNIPDKYFFRRFEEKYPSYVDYYVARFWLDLIDMLPVIREPLPQKLERIINDPERWKRKTLEWVNNQPDFHNQPEEYDKCMDIFFSADLWLLNRRLDRGYLSPPSPIYIYLSEDDMIHFVWDNRDIKIENIPVWSSSHGKFSLPKKDFFEEIQDFNDRFLYQMEKRVEWVTFTYSKVFTCFDFLKEEHKSRKNYLADKLKEPSKKENFDEAFEAIETMGIGYGV